MNDLKFALRLLRKNPGFTAVAILTLGIGIGASTALFSVANDMVLNPTTLKEADRTYQLNYEFKGGVQTHGLGSTAIQEIQKQEEFTDVAVYEFRTVRFENDGFTESIMAYNVTPGFFKFMGTPPLLGRGFSETDLTATGDTPIVLSHALWQYRFGGKAGLVGKSIRLGETNFTLAGVMPPHFRFPSGVAKCWLPLSQDAIAENRTSFRWGTLVKLAPGFAASEAHAYLDTLIDADFAEQPRSDRAVVKIAPLREMFVRHNLESTVWALSAAVVLVLLITWANMGNLLLARTETRLSEIAVRGALGADRFQIARLLLIETLLLGAAGGVAGLLVCHWTVKPLAGIIPIWAPQLRTIALDWQIFGIGLGVILITGLAIGIAPAWRASRRPITQGLRAREQGGGGILGGYGLMKTLVVSEIALAVALVAGAGLITQSVNNLLSVDTGYDPTHLMHVRSDLPKEGYQEPGKAAVIMVEMTDRIRALPGVKDASFYQIGHLNTEHTVAGHEEPIELVSQACSVGERSHFKTMKAKFVEGRDFTEADRDTSNIIMTQTIAQKIWPNQSALGKTLPRMFDQPPYVVVGVIQPLHHDSYQQEDYINFYRPVSRKKYASTYNQMLVRTQTHPGALTRAISEEMKAVAPTMRRPDFVFLQEQLYRSTIMERTFMTYMIAFASVGLFLAALGIFGLLAILVSRRTHEFGIRMSVGANRQNILRLVLAQGATMTAIGVALGLGLTYATTQFLESVLFGIAPNDPIILSAAIGVLTIAALLACYIPARRAANIQPMEALRHE